MGLKYCGGCAPRFDRVAQIKRITRQLDGVLTFHSAESANVEAILVVAGCPTCCVDTTVFHPKPILRIRCQKDAERFIEEMEQTPQLEFRKSVLVMD